MSSIRSASTSATAPPRCCSATSLRADVLCTVSDYTARQFLAGAEAIGGARLADSLAATIALRYPGLPPAAFARPSADTLAEFRQRTGLRPDSVLISTIGRLEEEKGLDTIVAMAELSLERQLGYEFVIAGTGSLAERLLAQAEALPNLTVTPNISSRDAQSLRAATSVGVFPTRVIPGFIETFCVAALEYQALAVPVLAGAIGGVPEATPDDRLPGRIEHARRPNGWPGSRRCSPTGRSAARSRAASPPSSPARSAPGGWSSWRSSPPTAPTGASR